MTVRNKFKNINRFYLDMCVKGFSENINDGGKVLDVGAGSGHYRDFFRNNSYYAIDMGLEQQHAKGLDAVGDICNLPFKDSSFENIICIEVLEHIWDSNRLMQELNRALKSSGTLLLTAPLCLGEHMQPYDFFRYTRFSLANLLEINGFEIIKIDPRGGYFTLLGYLISKIPDQVLKMENIPSFLNKPLKTVFRILFTYMLTPILLKLDYLDSEKHFTLGYICEARKASSSHSG